MKQLTQQIINQAENILKYIESDNYKQQILNQDISSVNSQYRQGDFTFAESIELLKKICNRIKNSEQEVDIIEFSMKNNIFTYLQNIYQWISQNPLGYWTNILQYTQTLYQWLNSWGINVFNVTNKNIENKIKNINIKEEEINKLQKLSVELESIKTASNKIDTAKDIIDFVNNSEDIKNIDERLKNATKYENDLANLKKETDKYIIVSHFSEITNRYRNMLFGKYYEFDKKLEWKNYIKKVLDLFMVSFKNFFNFIFSGLVKYIIYSVFLFIFSIILVIKYKTYLSIDIENQYLELLANASIRFICLLPSILILSLILNMYKRAYNLMEYYEFKSVISYALPGHILELKSHLVKENEKDNSTINDFISKTLNEIFSNSLSKKEENYNNNEGSFMKNLSENISFLEKIKSLIK